MQFYQPNITHLVFYFLLNSKVFVDKIKTPPPFYNNFIHTQAFLSIFQLFVVLIMLKYH